MTEKLLTIKEASKYLDIHPYTLYRWAKTKKVPAIKLGRVWRFRKERLISWLEKQENMKNK